MIGVLIKYFGSVFLLKLFCGYIVMNNLYLF